jgi:hypothetical protein
MQRLARLGGLEQPRRGFDKLLHFSSVDRFHDRLPAGEMAIESANADAGAPRDFFQAHVLSNFREARFGGLDEKFSVPGTVRARPARWRRRPAFLVFPFYGSAPSLTRHLKNGGYLRILNGGSLHFQLGHFDTAQRGVGPNQ